MGDGELKFDTVFPRSTAMNAQLERYRTIASACSYPLPSLSRLFYVIASVS